MLNQVQIIGRLGRSPELKYTQSGSPVCTLNIATDESYTDKNGNKVEQTEWHRVVLFNKQAENAAQYLDKGSLVFVQGKLKTRKWQDQNGNDMYTTEIISSDIKYLSWNNNNNKKESDNNQQNNTKQYQKQQQQSFQSDYDDAPF